MRLFHDDQNRIVIAQAPNISGGSTVGLIILSWIVSAGTAHSVLRGLAALTGLYWSYLEIRFGVNYFRRLIGGVVALMIASEAIRNLLS